MATKTFYFFSSFFLMLFLLRSILAVENLPASPTTNSSDFIRIKCNATLYPDLCYNSLSRYAFSVQQNPAQLARVAVSVSLTVARRMASYVSNLSHQPSAGAEPRARAALHDCLSTFRDAVDQIRRSLSELRHLDAGDGESFRFRMSNVQTWMSAALTNEDTCTDGFEMVSDGPVKSGVCDRAAKVKKFTSNALALVNSLAGTGESNENS